jgi:hypothetical protein
MKKMEIEYISWAFNSHVLREVKKGAKSKDTKQCFVFTYKYIEWLMWLYFRIEKDKPYNSLISEYGQINPSPAPRLKGDKYQDGLFFGTKELVLANIYIQFGVLEKCHIRAMFY